MNSVMKKVKRPLREAPFTSRIFGIAFALLSIAVLLFSATTANQWHSDGTEFENAWLPPDTGNICFGVWKEVAPRTVRLHHIGWLFTPGK
jgi:hypothetical protein